MGRPCDCCVGCETTTHHFNVDRYSHEAICFVKEEVTVYEQINLISIPARPLFSIRVLKDTQVNYFKDTEPKTENTWRYYNLYAQNLRGAQIAQRYFGLEKAPSPQSPQWKQITEIYPGIKYSSLYSLKEAEVTKSIRKLILKFNVDDIYDYHDRYKFADGSWQEEGWRFVQRVGLRLGGLFPPKERPHPLVTSGLSESHPSCDFKVNGAAKDIKIESINFDSFDDEADVYDLLYEQDHRVSFDMSEHAIQAMEQVDELGITSGEDNYIYFFLRPKEYKEVVDPYQEAYEFSLENEDISLYKRDSVSRDRFGELDGSKFVFGYWKDGPGPIWLEIYRQTAQTLNTENNGYFNPDPYSAWIRDYRNKNLDWHSCFKRVANGEYESTCTYMNYNIDFKNFLPTNYWLWGGSYEVEIFKEKTSNKKSGSRESYFKELFEFVDTGEGRIHEEPVRLKSCRELEKSSDVQGWDYYAFSILTDRDGEFKEDSYELLESPPEEIGPLDVPPNGEQWTVKVRELGSKLWRLKYRDITIQDFMFNPKVHWSGNVFPVPDNPLGVVDWNLRFIHLGSSGLGGSASPVNGFIIRDCVLETPFGKRIKASSYQKTKLETTYAYVPTNGKFQAAKIRFKLNNPPYYPEYISTTGGTAKDEKCLGACLPSFSVSDWMVLTQDFPKMGEPADFTKSYVGTLRWEEIPSIIVGSLVLEDNFDPTVFLDGARPGCITTIISDRKKPPLNEGVRVDHTYGTGRDSEFYEPSEESFFSTQLLNVSGGGLVLHQFGSARSGRSGVEFTVFSGGSIETETNTYDTCLNFDNGLGAPVDRVPRGDLEYTACDAFYGTSFRGDYYYGGGGNSLLGWKDFVISEGRGACTSTYIRRYNLAAAPEIYNYAIFDFELVDTWTTDSYKFTSYDISEPTYNTYHSIQTIYEPYVVDHRGRFDLFYKTESWNRPIGLRDLILGSSNFDTVLDENSNPDAFDKYEYYVSYNSYIAGTGIRFTIDESFFGYGLDTEAKSSKGDFTAVYQQWVPLITGFGVDINGNLNEPTQLTQEQIDEIAGYLTDFDYWYQLVGEMTIRDEDNGDYKIKDPYFYISPNGELNGPFENSGFSPTTPSLAVYDQVGVTFTGYLNEARYSIGDDMKKKSYYLPGNGGDWVGAVEDVSREASFPDEIITDSFVPRLNRKILSGLSATPTYGTYRNDLGIWQSGGEVPPFYSCVCTGCNIGVAPGDRYACHGVRIRWDETIARNVGVWVGEPQVVFASVDVNVKGPPGERSAEGDPCYNTEYGSWRPRWLEVRRDDVIGPIDPYCTNISLGSDVRYNLTSYDRYTCVEIHELAQGFPDLYDPTNNLNNILFPGESITLKATVSHLVMPQYEFDNKYTSKGQAQGSFISDTFSSFHYPDDVTFSLIYKKKIDGMSCELPIIDFSYENLLLKRDSAPAINQPPQKIFVAKKIEAELESYLDEEDLNMIDYYSIDYDISENSPVHGKVYYGGQDAPDNFRALTYGHQKALSGFTSVPIDKDLYAYFVEKYSGDKRDDNGQPVGPNVPNPFEAVMSALNRHLLASSGGDENLSSFNRVARITTLPPDPIGECERPNGAIWEFMKPCPMEKRYFKERDPLAEVKKEYCDDKTPYMDNRWPVKRESSGQVVFYVTVEEADIKDYTFTIGKNS